MADTELVEKVALAIEAARCIGREGPFGGYDYGYNPEFYGPPPEGGRYVIRDFRDPSSPDWGKWLHQTDDKNEHEALFEKMTREHYAQAALEAAGVASLIKRVEELEAQLEIALIEYEGHNGRHRDGFFQNHWSVQARSLLTGDGG